MLGDTLRRRKPARPSSGPAAPPRRRRFTFSWGRWLIAAVVILLVSFITGYLLSTQLLFPAPDTAGTGVPVPDLYAMEREEAEGVVVEAGLGMGRVDALASTDVPAGRVIAQSPVAGQQLRPGASVDLVLSAGPPELRVPPVEGLSAGIARDLLQEAGFGVDLKQVPSQAPQGVVARTDPPPGASLRVPAAVTLFISLGPPSVDPLPPPDTGGP